MTLGLIGIVENFWVVIGLIVAWALLFAASMPIRQTYLNGLIPSRQRATVLSFDSMVTSSGGVVVQPALGRAADLWGYAPSYLIGAGISALALPFLVLSRRQNASADTIEVSDIQATLKRSGRRSGPAAPRVHGDGDHWAAHVDGLVLVVFGPE